MEVPCMNCPNRHIGCHDTCKDYKAFDAERKAISRKKMAERRSSVPNYCGIGFLMDIPDRKRRVRR